jgi:transposase
VDRRRSASGAKTDLIDAYLLAKTGRADFADLHRLTPDSDKVAELKQLTRDQDTLIRTQTRLVNQLTACLKAYYPVALDLFSKLQQKSTLLFLQAYPTVEAARAASLTELQQQLQHTRHPHPADAAARIVEQLHHPQLQADAVLTRTKSRLMLALVSQLLPLMEQIADYDKEISTLFLTHEDHALFESLPRAGQHLAPRLLAEIGDDRVRYQDAGSLQALGGTSPVLYQSGMYSKAHRRLGCIKPLRNALHQFAWQSTPSVKRGQKTPISANERKAKATPLLSGRFRMCGSESSLQYGLVESVIRQRRLSWRSFSMPAELPSAASIAKRRSAGAGRITRTSVLSVLT